MQKQGMCRKNRQAGRHKGYRYSSVFGWLARPLALLACCCLLLSGCAKTKPEEKQDSVASGDTSGSQIGKQETGGQGQTGQPENQDSQEGLPLSEEPAELSIWWIWSNEYLDSPQEIPAAAEMEKRTNVKINYNLVNSGEASEKYGLLLASGDYPDILYQAGVSYPGGLEKGVEEGVLVDMTPYVTSIMPHYYGWIQSNEEVAKGVVTDTGKYIGMYSLTCNDAELAAERAWAGMVVRKGWLDRLEMELPVTIDDWTTMLEAFKQEIGCEYPLVVGADGSVMSEAFTSAYGITSDFYLDGGMVKFGPAQPAYKEYLELMASWFAAGYIDPNFTTDGTGRLMAGNEAVVGGKCGAFPTINGFLAEGYKNMGFQVEEGFYLAAVKNPVLNVGENTEFRQVNSAVNDCHAVVTTNCKDVELAAKWLDYQYTTEAMLFNNYGLENETYTYDEASGRYHLTEYVLNNPEGHSASDTLKNTTIAAGPGNCIGLYNWQRLEDTLAEGISEEIDVWNSDGTKMVIPNAISMTEEEGTAYNSRYTDLSTAVDEYTVNVILGNDTTDHFDTFLQTLEQLGLEECTKYKQAAYDRYLQR